MKIKSGDKMFSRTKKALIELMELLKCYKCDCAQVTKVSTCCQRYFCSSCSLNGMCLKCGEELHEALSVEKVYAKCVRMVEKINLLCQEQSENEENSLKLTQLSNMKSSLEGKTLDEGLRFEDSCDVNNTPQSEGKITKNNKNIDKNANRQLKELKEIKKKNKLKNRSEEIKELKTKKRRKRSDLSHLSPIVKKIKRENEETIVGVSIKKEADEEMLKSEQKKKNKIHNIEFIKKVKKEMGIKQNKTIKREKKDKSSTKDINKTSIIKSSSATNNKKIDGKMKGGMKKNRKGETELHLACIKGDTKKVKELLSSGCDVNAKDYAGWTSLHEACNHGHVEVVRLLLNHPSCNIHQTGCGNYTATHDAVEQDHLEVVKLLMDKGADLNQRTVKGETCFNLASSKEMIDLLKNHSRACLPFSPINHHSPMAKRQVSTKQNVVVTCSGFDEPVKEWIISSVQNLNWVMIDEFTEQVTHVVVKGNNAVRTFKYLAGLLLGKWIINIQWLEACVNKGEWVEEEDYEVVSCVKNGKTGEIMDYQSFYSIPFKARNNEVLQLPRLFDGCNFYIRPNLSKKKNNSKLRSELQKLISYGSGRLLSREPKAKNIDNYHGNTNDKVTDDEIHFDANTSLNKHARKSVGLALEESLTNTVPHHANNPSKFAHCCYFVVVASVKDDDDNTNKFKQEDNDNDNEMADVSKLGDDDDTSSNGDKNRNKVKNSLENVKYRFINRKLCYVTPSWLFDCVCEFAILE